MQSQRETVRLHPVELLGVIPKEISFTGHNHTKFQGEVPPEVLIRVLIPQASDPASQPTPPERVSAFYVAVAGYKENSIDEVEPESPYAMKVSLFAEFKIDYSILPPEKASEWIKKYSQPILMPYIREWLYSLSTKVGATPLMLPLVQVPTFKIELPDGTSYLS